mmetsp:Transcript_69527/g.182244  ORF Transcript_69527/g.182244 Transcript_69527/m.182244 type:complete len:296 (+) Transcript_69527:1248-2135(+)
MPSTVSTTLPQTRSMNSRSWDTSTIGSVCIERNCSSHSTLSRSKWFVGSSSSSTSGAVMKIFERPMRTFQPPENTPTSWSRSSGRKPTLLQMPDMRPSSSKTRRSSACCCKSVSVLMSSSSFSWSLSPNSSMSSCTCFSAWMTFCSVGTAARSSSLSVRLLSSSSTKPCDNTAILRSSWLFRILPSSGTRSPVRTRSCVVFPQPFAPTSATLSPVFAHHEASWRMSLPPRRCCTPFRPTPTVPVMPPVSMLKVLVSVSPRRLRMMTLSSSSSSSSACWTTAPLALAASSFAALSR